MEWYHVCWPRLTAKRVEPVVSISWASCKHLCYEERLTKPRIPSPELRRLYLDLTYCYKIVFGLVTLSMTDFFEFSQFTGTRGHAYKLCKPQWLYCQKWISGTVYQVKLWTVILWTASRQTCRSHVTSLHWRDIPARESANYTSRSRFANRVISAWNNQPTSVSFTSLHTFSRTIRSVDFRIVLKMW